MTGPVPLDAAAGPVPPRSPGPPVEYGRIREVVLTDEVSRTLFAEYAAHRATDRGNEETGWVLLGLREVERAVVLATLPAGAARDAGAAHVRFDAEVQGFASRIVRQADRRLTMLGVVHTHPGTLRHPSRGDFRGDRDWVPNLRGKEGVFGIGTVSRSPGASDTELTLESRPAPHARALGGLRFDWYTLAAGDRDYRPAAVEGVIGPDLAAPLRPVWDLIEAHAGRLDALARRFAHVRFDAGETADGPALRATIGLGTPGHAVRVLLVGKVVRFFHDADGTVTQFDLPASTAPDHGAYLALAELAARG